MRIVKLALSVLICISLLAYPYGSTLAHSDGNTFDRVRYNGGTVPNRVDPKDWGNHLSVNADSIVFTFKDGQRSEINPRSVTSLSYGQEAHRRVGTMIALAILVAPVALFGLFHKTRLHFIGVQYRTPDGKSAGLLLQGDKDNYRAILVALQSVSGVPVSVSDKDREFVPVGVTANIANTPGAIQASNEQISLQTGTGTVNLVSIPDGADIFVDDQFTGNAPATLKLKVGKRIIAVRKAGFSEWIREITISDGTVSLNAELLASTARQDVNTDATQPGRSREPYVRTASPQQQTAGGDGIGSIGVVTTYDEHRRVIIAGVSANGPAEMNGLKVGDLIVQLNGIAVKSKEQFDVAIASCKPGTQIRLAYMRNTWQAEATMVVGRE